MEGVKKENNLGALRDSTLTGFTPTIPALADRMIEAPMEHDGSTQSLDEASFTVERDVHAQKAPRAPVADLSGKGVYDAVSSNRSKMNDQAS